MTLTLTNKIFAKLLANENVDVVVGNSKTASFDVQSRVLSIPAWNNPTTYNLLCGHEVSHALYTPFQEWKEVLENIHSTNLTKDLVNIVEDVRIERLILKRYPGLGRDFNVGYRELIEVLNFFGVGEKRHFTIKCKSFLDRINLKAKGRNLFTVDFTDEEQELFDACYKTETFADVIELSKRIADFVNSKNKEEQKEESSSDKSEQGKEETTEEVEGSGSSDRGEGEEETDEEGQEETESQDEVSLPTQLDDVDGDTWTGEAGSSADEYEVPESLESETQKEFDKNLKTLVPRSDRDDKPFTVTFHVPKQENPVDFVRIDESDTTAYWDDQYDKFVKENKPIVNQMVREFEIRKKASQYRNAKVVKTGTLDMKKLHEYRHNDEIFVRGMKVPGGKSHGMAMLIDFSGSMGGVLRKVIAQTLQLVMFCQKTNIPFVVYTFTHDFYGRYERPEHSDKPMVYLDRVSIREVLNSNMSKTQFKSNATWLLCATHLLSQTPLIETLISLQPVLKEFKVANRLDRMNFVVLTDGVASTLRSMGRGDVTSIQLDAQTRLDVPTQRMSESESFGDDNLSKGILKWYKTSGAVDTTTHYFLMEKSARMQLGIKGGKRSEAVVKHNINGYDTKFLIPVESDILSSKTVDLEFDEDAKKSAIVRAFKKHAGSKKGNRVLVKTFADTIA